MLRIDPVYDITVTTNDGYELNYLFLTHPTPTDLLVATRERQDADTEEGANVRYNALREVLPLLREVPKPELKGSLDANIAVAGTNVGIIRVLCHPGIAVVTRGRKRKTEEAVDIQKLTPEQYKKLRETNPAALGQPTA